MDSAEPIIVNPDCAAGKHGICDGLGWDTGMDDLVSCPCACHDEAVQPKRIQLSRRKGWRKPEGAVVVARPSRWGNPFRVGSFYQDRSAFHDCPYPEASGYFMRWTRAITGVELAVHCNPVRDRAHAVELFRRFVKYEDFWAEDARRHLTGRDLACWCPLDQPCHADVLLELANAKEADHA